MNGERLSEDSIKYILNWMKGYNNYAAKYNSFYRIYRLISHRKSDMGLVQVG